MIKIKDLKVNEMVKMSLVVTSAIARETKAKKPYLQLELYDGTDVIQGNYWDWTSGKIPEKNAILDVNAQVTEYLNNKQLNIKSLSTNTELHLGSFMPTSNVDISTTYKDAYALASDIKNDFLRVVTLDALDVYRDLWLTIPGAKGVHHAFVGGTLVHSLSVAKIALVISKQIPESNDDLCIAGGLLHDIGKLFTYSVDGITIGMTDDGQMLDHTYIGARLVSTLCCNNMQVLDNAQQISVLEHIILSHHGQLEFGAAVPPMCIEAHIVNKADGIDASVQQVLEASRKAGSAMWTDRIYTLGNRPQLTPQYLKQLFSVGEE